MASAFPWISNSGSTSSSPKGRNVNRAVSIGAVDTESALMGAEPNPPTEAWASSLSASDVLLQAAQELDRRVDLGFADGDAFDVHAERQAFFARIVPDLGEDAPAELERRGERVRRVAQLV